MVSIYPLNHSHHSDDAITPSDDLENNITPRIPSPTLITSCSSFLKKYLLLKSEKNEKYQHFIIQNLNSMMTLLTSCFTFIIFIIRAFSIVAKFHTTSKLILSGQVLRLLSSVFGCLYTLKIFQCVSIHKCSFYSLGNLIVFFLSIGNGCVLISRSLAGKCPEETIGLETFCNPYSPWNLIPFDILLSNSIIAILFTVVFKTHHLWMAIVSILITIISILISVAFLGWPKSHFNIVYLFFIVIVYATITLEIHLHSSHLFESFHHLQETIEEKLNKSNEELLKQLQYTELHHMIGNVAHDLNTPLQALIMELDILEYHVKDCKLHQKDIILQSSSSSEGSSKMSQSLSQCGGGGGRPTKMDHYLEVKIQTISQSVIAFKYITSFMSMMIHRATDYNKIRNNIPLLPHYTPTNITEIFDYLEGCVVSSTADVPIVIDSLPFNVSPIITTDRIWLIENLLSLLSNAQKYTHDGSVTIRCRLENNLSKYQDIIQESNMILGHDTLPRPLKRKLQAVNGYRRPSQPRNIHLSSIPSTTTDGYYNSDMLSRSRSNDHYILFEVEDTGRGITPKKRDGYLINFVDKTEKLSYFPTNQSNRAVETGGGTGIGLYVISKRLEAMGGLFGVKPREDGANGSCFWFLFPYEPEPLPPPNDSHSLDSSVNTSNPNHSSPCPLESSSVKHSFDNIAQVNSFHTESRPNSFTVGSPNEGESEKNKNIYSFSPNSQSPPSDSTLHANAHTKANGISSPVHPSPQKRKILRILLVDDSILIQKTVSRALEQCGYFVDVANHGYECLSMIEKNQNEKSPQYDVILMDIQMPQLDGIEATRLIRQHERQINGGVDINPSSSEIQQSSPPSQTSPQIAKTSKSKPHFIIGFSANSDRMTYSNALEAGMDTFTSKPLSMEKFHMICETHGIFEQSS
jgi:CheY-like chemotaxis protein